MEEVAKAVVEGTPTAGRIKVTTTDGIQVVRPTVRLVDRHNQIVVGNLTRVTPIGIVEQLLVDRALVVPALTAIVLEAPLLVPLEVPVVIPLEDGVLNLTLIIRNLVKVAMEL